MDYLNNFKKKDSLATALLLLGAILVVATVSSAPLGAQASRFGEEDGGDAGFIDPVNDRKAPTVVSGDITSTLLGGLTTPRTEMKK